MPTTSRRVTASGTTARATWCCSPGTSRWGGETGRGGGWSTSATRRSWRGRGCSSSTTVARWRCTTPTSAPPTCGAATPRSALRAAGHRGRRRPDGAAAAWVNLGVALRRRGDFAGAEAAYRKAIEVDSQLVPGFANLYSLLRATGRTREAAGAGGHRSCGAPTQDPWLLLAHGRRVPPRRATSRGAERLFRQARSPAPRRRGAGRRARGPGAGEGRPAQGPPVGRARRGARPARAAADLAAPALGLPRPPPLQRGDASEPASPWRRGAGGDAAGRPTDRRAS